MDASSRFSLVVLNLNLRAWVMFSLRLISKPSSGPPKPLGLGQDWGAVSTAVPILTRRPWILSLYRRIVLISKLTSPERLNAFQGALVHRPELKLEVRGVLG
jgi:hypothetical protein